MDRRIDFFLIGAERSGTTSLFDYLTQHPDIFLPSAKENRYFVWDEYYSLGERFLDILYVGLRDEKVVGGACVELLGFPEHAYRVHQYNPSMKLLVALRNPIDRAYSAYWFYRQNGWEQCESFEEALAKNSERCQGDRLQQWMAYLPRGYYYNQLRQYYSLFDGANVFVSLYEDLRDDCEQTLRSILRWLEVAPDLSAIDLTKRSNVAGRPRLPWLQRALMARNPWFKRIGKRLTTPEVRYHINRAIARLLKKNVKPFSYPEMRPETREELARHYLPHNEKLSKLINRDLSHWR